MPERRQLRNFPVSAGQFANARRPLSFIMEISKANSEEHERQATASEGSGLHLRENRQPSEAECAREEEVVGTWSRVVRRMGALSKRDRKDPSECALTRLCS